MGFSEDRMERLESQAERYWQVEQECIALLCERRRLRELCLDLWLALPEGERNLYAPRMARNGLEVA